ncbi:MAG: AAA family ATPase, partial [Clostridia bacterium]|nr:AAA family ATPase [Clostridia bacterium]
AIADALLNGVMVLTGGPGTGKTTIIKGLISIFRTLDYEVCLAAPTGRAAKRMSEATSHEAKTIHRLLEMDAADESGLGFLRNDRDPLDEDVIIIDEASMIDIMLMEALLKAVKNGARLILIGDGDQLPSVGAGNVLSDICASEEFCVDRLTEVFRQSEESLIITNAHMINEGKIPELHRTDADFFYLKREGEESIRDTVIDLVRTRLPRSYGADIANRIQIITPSRKGMSGTEVLNMGLQDALNPPCRSKKERRSRDLIFREGDRVMQTKNNYSVEWITSSGKAGMGIYNGDIGTVLAIDTENETVEIRFDDRLCVYDFTMLEELDHAYAITVHKSQGSEYPVVIVPLFRCAPMLQTRNLLYTAVTRASKMVILVGSYGVLTQMVANNTHSERCTLLGDYLKKDFL